MAVTRLLQARDRAVSWRREAGRMPSRHSLREDPMKKLALICTLILGSALCVAVSSAGSGPSFAAAKSYPAGSTPASVAVGDLNGDGKVDLATANSNPGTLSVLLN